MILSNDEKYMFSGSVDGSVIVWHTENWIKLCEFGNDSILEICDLNITDDD